MTLKPAFEVIGLGASPVDILSLVEEFPTGESVHQAQAMAIDGGGPVATAMATLARLGARTAMVDVIGDDWRGQVIRQSFLRLGVGVDFLRVQPGRTSATSSILVRRRDGARVIVFFPGDGDGVTPADLPRAAIAAARFLHVNGRHWEACLEACRLARQHGVQVSFDGGAHRYRPDLDRLMPLVDICIVARQFAEAYTGETDVHRAGMALLAEGARLVAITDGLHGSWIFPAGQPAFHQPAFQTAGVVDTTGCGDSYHGAFLFGLLRGFDLRQTAALASAVAALNTRGLGGRAGLPTLEEAVAFMAQARPLEERPF
ncbi:MAG: carbohydrate kinase [Chloroflexi bacterium]|nr:MAG: carbohydrate kinase [Chloroflexota bacterium]